MYNVFVFYLMYIPALTFKLVPLLSNLYQYHSFGMFGNPLGLVKDTLAHRLLKHILGYSCFSSQGTSRRVVPGVRQLALELELH